MSEVTILYLIKQLELAVRTELERVTSECDLTPPQYTALTVLERRPGLTSAKLARNSFVRPQSMAQVTSQLEARGLISRQRDADSKRQFLLFLTPQGQQAVDALRDPVAAIERRLISGFEANQAAEFKAALRLGRHSLGGSSSD